MLKNDKKPEVNNANHTSFYALPVHIGKGCGLIWSSLETTGT